MAAPAPVLGALAEGGAHRVRRDVRDGRPELLVGLDPDRPVATLKEVPVAIVALVEDLRVRAVEPLHPAREIRVRGLDQQVHVVVHQAIAEAAPLVAVDHAAQEGQVGAAVAIVDEDQLPAVATRIHVVEPTRDLFARLARHAELSAERGNLTPRLRGGQTP
jgi:hypothetical protein